MLYKVVYKISVLHNLFFKAIFGQDYPNLGRVMQHTMPKEFLKRINHRMPLGSVSTEHVTVGASS